MDSRQLFIKLLEATYVNNVMTRDTNLMLESLEYFQTQKLLQVDPLDRLTLALLSRYCRSPCLRQGIAEPPLLLWRYFLRMAMVSFAEASYRLWIRIKH